MAATGDLAALRIPAAHAHYRRSVSSVGSEGLLHLAIHYMPSSTAEERAAVASQVIAVCSPTWHGQGSSPMPATLDAAN